MLHSIAKTTKQLTDTEVKAAKPKAKVCAIALKKRQGSFEQGEINGAIELLCNEIDSAYACDLDLQYESKIT